ncbi:hypothetical protein [Streptomyces albospinus]|nr:hypothetical protein [Streptomyces albospinus]
MTADRAPRYTVRSIAALSALSLSALLALAAEPAHADSSTCGSNSNTGCLDISLAHSPKYILQLNGDGSSHGNDLVLKGGSPAHNWNFEPVKVNGVMDGSFQIRNNDPGKAGCVDVQNNGLTLNPNCNSAQSSQKFYVQPSGSSNAYLLRSVSNDECVSSAATGNQINSLATTLQGCVHSVNGASASGNQPLTISSSQSGGSGPTLDDLATYYALNQYNNRSGVISSASYTKSDPQPSPSQGPFTLVSNQGGNSNEGAVCQNSAGAGGGNFSCSMSWSQSTADAVTESAGLSLTLGPGSVVDSPVKAEVSAQLGFSKTSTTTTTSGSSYNLTVPPGRTAWVVRSLPIQSSTGTWTFTSDIGVQWQHQATVNMPMSSVTDPASGKTYTEILTQCDTASTDAMCTSTKPAGV